MNYFGMLSVTSLSPSAELLSNQFQTKTKRTYFLVNRELDLLKECFALLKHHRSH